jgi:hypothetical protein
MAYGEPDWASPGDTSNAATVNAATPSPTTSSTGVGQNTDTGSALYVRFALRLSFIYSRLRFRLAAAPFATNRISMRMCTAVNG